MSLSEIDKLIEQTKYNEALQELTKLMQEDPATFDSAQKRVKAIMKARAQFNDHAQALISTMEEGNNSDVDQETLDRKKMETITAMEKSEKLRGNEATELTNDARRSITLQYYINRINGIMAQTDEMLTNGENDVSVYAKSAIVSREGLTIKTSGSDVVYNGDEEIPVVYDSSITRSVDRAISSISSEVDNLDPLIKNCQTSYESLISAIRAQNASESRRYFKSFNSDLSKLCKSRNKIYAQGEILNENDQKALEQQKGLSTTYIAFAVLSTFGSPDNPNTGIIGAIDSFINLRLENLKDALYLSVHNSTKNISSQFPLNALFTPHDYASLTASVQSSADLALMGKDLQDLYKLVDHSPARELTSYGDSMDFATYYFSSLLKNSLSTLKGISEKSAPVSSSEQKSGEEKVENPRLTDEEQLHLIHFYEDIHAFCLTTQNDEKLKIEIARSEGQGKAKTAVSAAGKAQPVSVRAPGIAISNLYLDWSTETTFLTFLLGRMQGEAIARSGIHWGNLALAYASEANTLTADFSKRYDQALEISGTDEKAQAALKDELLALNQPYYPSKAISILTDLNADVSAARKKLVSYRNTLDEGAAYESSQLDYRKGKQELSSIISSLDSYTQKNNQLIAKATARANQAKLASQEALSLYNRAVQNLKKNQFDQARENLSRSRTRYTDSFLFEENETLRADSDARLTALDGQIADAHQRIVVTQTRELKTAAWNAYYNGDFETAERNLIRARDLWSITNGDNEDQETSDLLAMVHTALSMKTGRTIPVTAPLYPEMSQILSISHQYYSQGASLMAEGKKDEAEKILNQAKEKLRTLQLVYPMNQDASLLNLRIDNLIDPDNFKKTFAKKVEDSKKNKNRQEAYANLTDLRQINPSYPGLDDLILKLEYETGIRAKPIQNTAKTQAKNLVAQARKIYNGAKGKDSELDKAIALLDKAIALNPQESSASSLKDTIQIERGARASGILSAADESIYLVAIQELSRNNVVNANAMVEQLMQKGNNKQVKKLQDLNRRIKAML